MTTLCVGGLTAGSAYAADAVSPLTLEPSPPVPVPAAIQGAPAPACSDGIDNDADGKADFPADPGCSYGAGPSETVPNERWMAVVDRAECDDADVNPDTAPLNRVHDATLCLINSVRWWLGRPLVTTNSRLRRAAVAHAADMVSRQYFSHDEPGGVTLVDRLARTGYVGTRYRWVAGENLAWGSGPLSTPRQTVRGWMQSDGHRENLLARDYQEIGIGITRGAPVPGKTDGVTYATEYGARKPLPKPRKASAKHRKQKRHPRART